MILRIAAITLLLALLTGYTTCSSWWSCFFGTSKTETTEQIAE